MDDYAAMLRAQEELIENGRMEAEFKNAHRYPLSMKSGHKIMLDTGLAFIHYEHHDELWNIIDRNHAVMLATHPHDSIDQYHDWKPVDSNESCMPASNAISAKSIRVMRGMNSSIDGIALMKHDTAIDISIRAVESLLFLIEAINNEHEQQIPFPVITECHGIMGNNIKLSYGGIIIICDSYGYYEIVGTPGFMSVMPLQFDVIAFIRRNVR